MFKDIPQKEKTGKITVTCQLPEMDSYEQFIREVLKVDEAVYPVDLQGRFEDVYARFMYNKEMLILLLDESKIIGYLALLPVKDEMYQRILTEDRLFDNDIPIEMFERYEAGKSCNLYAVSVAILPEYQGCGYSNILAEGFRAFLLNKKRQGIDVKNVIATTVSSAGERLAQKFGLETVKTLKNGYTVKRLTLTDSFYEEKLLG